MARVLNIVGYRFLMKTDTLSCRPLWERSARHDIGLPSFWSQFSNILDRLFKCPQFPVYKSTSWFACGQLSGLFECTVSCVSELATVCVRGSAFGCLPCRGSTFLLVAMKRLALLYVILAETLDTASFSLTASYWTTTYRKVQMLIIMALYTYFTKEEFFTFRMSTVWRYAGDGNLMTPIGKTLRRFPLNLVTD